MNKKLILKNILSGTILLFLFAPMLILAQTPPQTPTGTPPQQPPTAKPIEFKITIDPPFKGDKTIQGFIEMIINDLVIPIGGVIAVLMIMYAGFLFVTAGGDPGKITKAKDALLYAAIGAAILLGAWTISKAIGGTIDQLKK